MHPGRGRRVLVRDLSVMTGMYLDVFSEMEDEGPGANAEDIRDAMPGRGYHLQYIVNGTADRTMPPTRWSHGTGRPR